MARNLFNSVKVTRPKKSVFDLSHDVKLSCNMGQLIPVMCTECVPSDKFNIGAESIVRFAPIISPVMHRFDVSIHYFFVPHRLSWKNWGKYITNTPVSGNLPAFPTVAINETSYTPLCDYLGLPTPNAMSSGGGGSQTTRVSALPFAAYQRIYNEYYRDQNLQFDMTTLFLELQDGNNDSKMTELATLRNRCWEHDYFTAALPFAQKGSAVDLPLGDVTLKSDWGASPTPPTFKFGGGADQDDYPVIGANQGGIPYIGQDTGGDTGLPTAYDPKGSLEVGATTINDLRRAFKLQEWLEKAARGGSRLVENIQVFFGIKSPDSRLQRPEYITGVKSPVMISEVLNTAGGDDLPQGNMAGHGIGVVSGQSGSYFCQEHGYIVGIMSIMPKTAYQQGVPKHFLKTTDPFEHAWPEFAHLGEQPVLGEEIFGYMGDGYGKGVFGYVPRYAEYKFENNRVAGDFRNTLDFWHLGRIFEEPPVLNAEFVRANPDTRIFAVEDPDVQKMYVHVYNKVRAIRPLPKYGTPTF